MTKKIYKFISLVSFFAISCNHHIPSDIAMIYDSLPDRVDFNFHVKPILSDRCYKCHGPDDNARESELRLDVKENAFASLRGSDGFAFVKGDLDNSVAWQRIVSNDPDFQMPHPESNLSLSTREKALITKWIVQGAEWKDHWAFIPPEEPKIPHDFPNHWEVKNPIDNFVLSKLNEQDLSPSERSDKERLIRRVTMDLTGLPPTIEEIENFLSDDSDYAYGELVERLLATDAHAERMAMEWLDVARYADSQGMHIDRPRYHWPWRDWVIESFRENMAYDDFVTWQIAGDLFPEATIEQKLATAFHRNHPISAEGGIIDEEFRQKYVQDRTNTTATAFLGMTMECASCHDHKFDPISQKEYYQMSSFFNNLKEIGMVAEGGVPSGPVLLLPGDNEKSRLDDLSEKINEILLKRDLIKSEAINTNEHIKSIKSKDINAPIPNTFYPFETVQPGKLIIEGYRPHRTLNNMPIGRIVDENPNSIASGNPRVVEGMFGKGLRLKEEFDLVFLKNVGNFELNEPFSASAWVRKEEDGKIQTIMGTSSDLESTWRGWDFLIDSLDQPSVRIISYWPQNYVQITGDYKIPLNEWNNILFTYDGSSKASGIGLYVNGEKLSSNIDYDNLYRPILHTKKRMKGNWGIAPKVWEKTKSWRVRPVIVGSAGRFYTGENGVFSGSIDHIKLFDICLTPIEVAALFEEETNVGVEKDTFSKENYMDHYLNRESVEYQELTQQLQRLLDKKLDLMYDVPEIMVMEDMPTPRKTFVLDRGQYDQLREEVMPGTPKHILSFDENFPKNRLGLSKWLFDSRNPLTARVTVNRYWQMIFGRGIVETPQDFGNQGSLPSHPELLDWLSTHFIESGWDLRGLIRDMVTSAIYRQSSVITEDHASKDPRNIYLARSPSYRLQAEMIRDNALAASGLLNRQIGGASVKPYRPLNFFGFKYHILESKEYNEDELYRRSMYTFIRRTTPHPAMTVFDTPPRSVCVVKREITNTPLQALVLLNDPQFVEAARVLAERMQKEGGNNIKDQTVYAFRLLTGRKPTSNEIEVLMSQYDTEFARFEKNPDMALELLGVGESPFDINLDTTRTAALAMVASTMINHDEAYMKR